MPRTSRAAARDIIDAVRRDGDAALLALTENSTAFA
jgi:histidinol dehydrogenase